MAIFDKTGLLQKLVQKIRSNGIGGLTRAVDVRTFLTDLIDTMFSLVGQSTSGDQNLEWDAEGIYNTTDNQFAVWNLRIFKSKIDNNLGNTPPSVANEAGDFENEFWVEVSPAPASGITAWAPGVFGSGLKIVYHNKMLYELIVPDVDRPFESTDIAAEIAAGKWEAISGGSGGGSAGLLYKLHFYNFNSYTESFFEERTINSIQKDTNVSQVFYTKNALSEQEVPFPFVGTITAADGDKITWRIVFAANKFDGTIQIKGE